MSTIATGMALGAGSEVGHQAVRSMMGGGSGHGSQPAQQEPAQEQYQQQQQQPVYDHNPCYMFNQSLMSCLQNNRDDMGMCQNYMNSLSQCERDNGMRNYQ